MLSMPDKESLHRAWSQEARFLRVDMANDNSAVVYISLGNEMMYSSGYLDG